MPQCTGVCLFLAGFCVAVHTTPSIRRDLPLPDCVSHYAMRSGGYLITEEPPSSPSMRLLIMERCWETCNMRYGWERLVSVRRDYKRAENPALRSPY
ncbi:hypothetical protein SKAU_G00323540 [Synaphobranchus kaupii]|uniref:Secreted protein n=1 Tax=Synaphobranchus kaupii TaxID=118154 RepID=A0A9Q1EPB1_SYNKA|nr:hypothetical protein SKAU_G00323540 [Synaphobranchus kaupii]